jgi:hypothetical protein
MTMLLQHGTSCNSLLTVFASLFLLIAFSAGDAFTASVYVPDESRPPPPHQLKYTRPLPYHRLVEQESQSPHASSSAPDAVPHAIESRIHSSPDAAYHSPADAPAHYLPAAPLQQTQLHLLPPQPLPSSLYPRHPGQPGEYQSEYGNQLHAAEADPSQESHPLEPVYENSDVPEPHYSGPREDYHLRLKYDHAPQHHQPPYSGDLQPHSSSHAHGFDVPAKTELYHSQDVR